MQTEVAAAHTLLLGIGNILLSDDGVGVHAIRALEELKGTGELHHTITTRDGGTIGLALLSEFNEFGGLIVIDAMELGAAPGAIRTFQDAEMDRQLGGKKRTAHEVALADLITAAKLADCAPPRRALVAIQPGSTQWGLSPTDEVRDAIPNACEVVLALIEEWNDVL